MRKSQFSEASIARDLFRTRASRHIWRIDRRQASNVGRQRICRVMFLMTYVQLSHQCATLRAPPILWWQRWVAEKSSVNLQAASAPGKECSTLSIRSVLRAAMVQRGIRLLRCCDGDGRGDDLTLSLLLLLLLLHAPNHSVRNNYSNWAQSLHFRTQFHTSFALLQLTCSSLLQPLDNQLGLHHLDR